MKLCGRCSCCTSSNDEKQKEECLDATRIKRFVSPLEIAHSVRYMIENDALTGQNLVVEGGLGIKFVN